MQYFAIGEDNGGAGERRLGPFDTAEEAQAAGQRETKDSNGGFVFRGIVDEANNQVGFDIEPIVSTNSVVMNALTANRRVARNAEEFDENFVRTKLDSIYNDLDDLEDYVTRFQAKSPKAAKYKSAASRAKSAIHV